MNNFVTSLLAQASGSFSNPLTTGNALDFLKNILGSLMYMAVPVIGVVLLYAGFLFISARGNSEKVKTATYNLTFAIAGVALVLSAYAISRIFYTTIVVNILGWN